MDFIKEILPDLYNIDCLFDLYKSYNSCDIISYNGKKSAVSLLKSRLSTLEAGPFGMFNENNFKYEYLEYLKTFKKSKIIFSDISNMLKDESLDWFFKKTVVVYWMKVDEFSNMLKKFNRNRRRNFKKLHENISDFSVKNGEITDLLYIFNIEENRKHISGFDDEFIKGIINIDDGIYRFRDFEIYYKGVIVGAFIYYEFNGVLVEFMAYFDKTITDLASDFSRYYLLDYAYKKGFKYYCFGLTPEEFKGVDLYKKSYRPESYSYNIYTFFRNRFIFLLYWLYKVKLRST